MKSLKILGLAGVFAFVIFGLSAFINLNSSKKLTAINNTNGFALVELFTSEGCSSCPPADELVARVEKESQGKPVYILAYHVDYWNRLGWKDQFSSAEFSARQSQYSRYLNLNGVYTPQIVVNGRTEFVGSEEGKLRNSISANLQKANNGLTVSTNSIDGSQLKIKYNVTGSNSNMALMVAMVEKNAVSKVESGENGGRTLSHVQIVRKLQKFNLTANSGEVNLALPHGFNIHNGEIIAFLQNLSNGAITGAAKTGFTMGSNPSAAVIEKR